MSVPFFYEPTLTSGCTSFTLSEESSKHCIQVLRMQEGDRIDLTNGIGQLCEATITVANKKNTIVSIQSEKIIPASNQKIVLGISLLKNAVRLEWLLEKATEMGVHTIVPLVCDRTIHERFKTERMQNILQSAMIQSQQAWLPILTAPTKFKTFIDTYNAPQQYIAHCEQSERISIKELAPSNDCILLIGPEGDFTPAEIEHALINKYQAINLGPTRLRTETAGIFALSVLKKF